MLQPVADRGAGREPVAVSAGAPLVLHVFSNFVASGPELRAVRLMEAFGPGLRHAILSMDGRIGAVERIPVGACTEIVAGPPKGGTLATALRLRETLRRLDPDLVLTYNWGAFDALVAAASVGLRALVHHEDGFNPDEAERLKRRRVLARRLVLPTAARVVVPSRRLETIARERWRVPPARLARIPNGIPLDGVAAGGGAALRRAIGIPSDAAVVGTVAHLRAEKALERLVGAAAAPGSDWHLLVVGDGPERDRLERMAAASGIAGRVHFVGHQDRPARWYGAFDVFALSSRTEQLPLSLLEAMAAGLPVVSTEVGDVADVLPTEQRPWVVPAEGEVERGLARSLAGLLADPALRRRLGRANRHRVATAYEERVMIQRYAEVYGGAIRGGADRWSAAVGGPS